MFCSKCGVQLDEDAVFCKICGTKNDTNKNNAPITVEEVSSLASFNQDAEASKGEKIGEANIPSMDGVTSYTEKKDKCDVTGLHDPESEKYSEEVIKIPLSLSFGLHLCVIFPIMVLLFIFTIKIIASGQKIDWEFLGIMSVIFLIFASIGSWLVKRDKKLFEKAGFTQVYSEYSNMQISIFPIPYLIKRQVIQSGGVEKSKKGLLKWFMEGGAIAIAVVIAFMIFSGDSTEDITGTATAAVNEIITEHNPNSSVECTEVKIEKELSKDNYEGIAYLSNGRQFNINITVRRSNEGDKVEVGVPTEEIYPILKLLK